MDENWSHLSTRRKQTIDAADYDFDLENVANALASAARGVRVRMVTDTDTLTNDNPRFRRFDILKQAKIPIVDDQRGPIMHDKFMIVDGEWVWTGSWNFTDGDTYRLNNNAIKIVSRELAQNYTAEFEKMFVQRKFGPSKPGASPDPLLTLGGVPIENYFAPEDGVAAQDRRPAEAAPSSRSTSWPSRSPATRSARDACARQGRRKRARRVRENRLGDPVQRVRADEAGRAGCLQDGNPYVMHHKVIIIDGRTVIFGSFNFSNNADKDNDENC